MFDSFQKPLSPKAELIKRLGKHRYVNLVAFLLCFADPEERGSYERFKAVVAAIESELRAAEASPLPFVQSYIRRVRNNPLFQEVLRDISKKYYEEKYEERSFVDFFALVDGAYIAHAKTEEERNLYIECRCLIVEKILKIEGDIFRPDSPDLEKLGDEYEQEGIQIKEDLNNNFMTSKHLREIVAWVANEPLSE